MSDDESSEDGNNADFEFSVIANGDYVDVQYAQKHKVVYYTAVVPSSTNNDEMFTVSFFKCNGQNISFLMNMIMVKLVLNVFLKNFHHLKLSKS